MIQSWADEKRKLRFFNRNLVHYSCLNHLNVTWRFSEISSFVQATFLTIIVSHFIINFNGILLYPPQARITVIRWKSLRNNYGDFLYINSATKNCGFFPFYIMQSIQCMFFSCKLFFIYFLLRYKTSDFLCHYLLF